MSISADFYDFVTTRKTRFLKSFVFLFIEALKERVNFRISQSQLKANGVIREFVSKLKT